MQQILKNKLSKLLTSASAHTTQTTSMCTRLRTVSAGCLPHCQEKNINHFQKDLQQVCDVMVSIEAIILGQNLVIDMSFKHPIAEFFWSKPYLHTLFGYKVMIFCAVYFLMYLCVFYFIFLPVSQFHICQLWPPWLT